MKRWRRRRIGPIPKGRTILKFSPDVQSKVDCENPRRHAAVHGGARGGRTARRRSSVELLGVRAAGFGERDRRWNPLDKRNVLLGEGAERGGGGGGGVPRRRWGRVAQSWGGRRQMAVLRAAAAGRPSRLASLHLQVTYEQREQRILIADWGRRGLRAGVFFFKCGDEDRSTLRSAWWDSPFPSRSPLPSCESASEDEQREQRILIAEWGQRGFRICVFFIICCDEGRTALGSARWASPFPWDAWSTNLIRSWSGCLQKIRIG